MTVQALRLRNLSWAEAQVRERLGAGLCLNLTQPAPTTLHLRLAPAAFNSEPATALESVCGRFWLDNAEPLLSAISACPAILADPLTASTQCSWYWPLYNQYLAPELQAIWSPLQTVIAPPVPGLDCLLELRGATLGTHTSRLRISAETLLRWLENAAWQSNPGNDNEPIWPVHIPLLLGHCSLSRGELLDLQPGDVLLIHQALFSADGQGSLQIGACRLHLRQLPGTALHFTLTELEDLTMNASLDHFALADQPVPSEVQPSAPGAESTRFDDLPLALTLRAGSLHLSLGQLRNLGVGSVLRFNGCTPGEATLCHGERVLAQGELVDIEGRLGLQITRLEPRL
ncbi:type III secretion system cytoplasmic ring protein SctQ [Pseudomonas sp. RSB 5.4]|uniref:type III secretion system cytoplasmic ring protein SctQ n=1 Tax=Pseudomonas sp. RSB 5.4 TaxID=3127459 RepID=UPI0030D2BC4E